MVTAKSTRSAAPPSTPALSDPMRERIDAERRRLQKASALLACLVYALNHEFDEFDAGDVVSVVAELVERAMNALDFTS